ncbi:MAG: ribonuclease G [Gammaproteobacteria bacterium]|nr:ribonuclease G [Gammaproteobacteria bacterium]NIR84432.1 ribonuclease G [Gammaproteobacteria bacterium]NIR90913.1 ribonuclease G [Gammaproteobacteria bacterium]NIU07099.1 ribonuclease G [Gammaproteobacteria bacterium]NIV76228.1 ribonuclease G [Gammaproteobacteria bacterium]
MSGELLINVQPTETRVAVIENGMLQEIFVERANRRGLVGNIYKGRVSRVLPGMQAAFVDIGLPRAAFLHASDITALSRQACYPADERTLADAAESELAYADAELGEPRTQGINELLREGQEVLVQVVKDPLGTKGARLTTQISIPSCYLVYMPYGRTVGVSQRIEDEAERLRLRELVRDYLHLSAGSLDARVAGADSARVAYLTPPGGYIVRTAAESIPDEMLIADMRFLQKLWRSLEERARRLPACSIVHEDLPLVVRVVRELTGTDIERVRIDSRSLYESLVDFARQFIPEMVSRTELYAGERPVFDLYGVEDEIQRALQRKVELKSGGHLIIDQTEAMTTIDVNTGAYVGQRNLEETIFKTNLEAAQAIARQLRLRNLGGIIIIDFIDMESEEHKRQVLRALEKSLERDHTKTQISEVSSLGLVQMTRKRSRESLEHVLCEACPTCGGRGSVKTPETVCYEIFREILREARQFEVEKLLVLASREVIDKLMDEESTSFAELEDFIGKPIVLQTEPLYSQEQYDIVLM